MFLQVSFFLEKRFLIHGRPFISKSIEKIIKDNNTRCFEASHMSFYFFLIYRLFQGRPRMKIHEVNVSFFLENRFLIHGRPPSLANT